MSLLLEPGHPKKENLINLVLRVTTATTSAISSPVQSKGFPINELSSLPVEQPVAYSTGRQTSSCNSESPCARPFFGFRFPTGGL